MDIGGNLWYSLREVILMEKLFDLLKLAYRQRESIYRVGRLIRGLQGSFSVRKLVSVIVAFFEMFACVITDSPITPLGGELDLSGYSLVFEDEFNSDTLDMQAWSHRGLGPRRCGFNGASQVRVEDGKLVITGEYLENGEYGPGWYVGMIKLNKQYKHGYFEIRCICNKGADFWSAFWIQAEHPYDHSISQGGIGGAELDIFESVSRYEDNRIYKDAVTSTVHCNGGDEDIEHIDSCMVGQFRGKNIHDEYNTYGLKWTEDEYIFYINGVESGRTSFSKGVSDVPEDVIVSLEIPDEGIRYEKDYKTKFIVDYVKIWQTDD